MGDGSTEPGVGHRPSLGQHDSRTNGANPGRLHGLTVGRNRTVGMRMRRAIARFLVRGADTATRWVTRLLGESPTAGRAQISEAELRDLVAHSDVLDGEERRLIDDVIAAGDRHVRELMVPRTEVVFLDAGATVAQAARLVREARHSRFPVIDGTHDDVIGFVHLRDLLIRPDIDPVSTVADLARPVCTFPASKRILAALSEMRREGDHLALVVDEYGGTAGIVTLEDLIEELVGEIHDEYDARPEPRLPDGTAPSEVDGLLNLNDFADRVGLALPHGPYDTVGGFLMATLGRLPTVGDEVLVPAGDAGWQLTVVGMEGRRVSRVALALRPDQPRPEPRSAQPRPEQLHSDPLSTRRLRPDQPATGQLGTGQPLANHVRPDQLGTDESRPDLVVPRTAEEVIEEAAPATAG